MKEVNEWHTISDLAKTNGISRKTVWAWINSGKLQSHRFGAQHRISETDWQEFLTECNRRNKIQCSR